ncbi:VWA domain-containing protein [Sandaracinus amylolyticus]|uniref:Uncharacterized protein n=1 Tax=Sandaracinus amylolyticus TaxID=927083 RepID=A0A0F6YK82_9BACT|nr:VWA domain-containing protein [Sandaracinus amylolyticus]AKF07791.1 hypothetical protein DB32_004940 [Sandaracinus amylolyticus]
MSKRSALVITVVASILGACTSRGTPGREATFAECTNGVDDDDDGLLDCADTTCGAHCEGGNGGGDASVPRDSGPRVDARITCDAPLDVVFVIDVSTSMREEAERLRTGVESIWNAAQDLTSNTQFGLVVFVDDAVAVNGCSPFASIASLQSELMRWRDFCASNRSPSSDLQNTDCTENSLDALHLAATTCPWRAGATRVIVHVTDDTFAERPQRLSDAVTVQHTYAEVASELVTRELRVGAFAVPGAGEPCGAGSSPDVGRGFHAPFGAMPSLPMQTRGRAYDLRAVRSGSLDMAASITELLADEYCTLF